MKKFDLKKGLTYAARIWSLLSIGFLLVLFLGHIFSPEGIGSFKPIEIVAALFFPVGAVIGMIIAWKKELIGGLVTVVSLVIFSFLVLFPRGVSIERGSLNFLILCFPGFLFMTGGLIDRFKKKPR